MKKVLTDSNAVKQFYHIADCGIFFKNILEDSNQHENDLLIHKFHLQSITLQIFIYQLLQYKDDKLSAKKRAILRVEPLTEL